MQATPVEEETEKVAGAATPGGSTRASTVPTDFLHFDSEKNQYSVFHVSTDTCTVSKGIVLPANPHDDYKMCYDDNFDSYYLCSKGLNIEIWATWLTLLIMRPSSEHSSGLVLDTRVLNLARVG